ncbi:UDP-N-acetylmuramoyl-tripeptide--D-alanyl-D-alanine ligase [Ekhidna lutea]|uniref:UDP-N-acetylmuramoyl-tripeptide--D-alanyl-D-alanine ligase n=1 Tax=Ekhidna lutea TaxID=447679 RepID=A0A239ISS8_EKHLU|nr:UDP-N-acetylmuramoyl-tripeptide--D-alanyl-D-alanine ligase [Ekhidna lutea]SNS96629.1 UDP-N-acetylmuramoyl-tripeptide--D-alanyl-D-alanine ligase [Ekhidna lutea]
MGDFIEFLYSRFLLSDGVSIDTRTIEKGNLFFAISGPNFNANKFAEEALAKGASYVVVDDKAFCTDDRIIYAEDCLKSLQNLAVFHRDRFKRPVLGITGSNGKTTTKELITRVLSKKYTVHATKGNYNNHIGVPLTLLHIHPQVEIAVIEMGANHVGEIAMLCEMAKPTHGLITNIGHAHTEGFGGFEGVIRGKSELFDYLRKSNGQVLINTDDEVLSNMAKRFQNPGIFPSKDLDLTETAPTLEISLGGKTKSTQLIGKYNFSNIAAAVCVGRVFDVTDDEILESIASYVPDNSRSQVINKNGVTIILDAYNANPDSMKAALENLAEYGVETIAVLGDMNELDNPDDAHHELLAIAKELGISDIYTIGDKIGKVSKANHFASKEALVKALKATKLKGKTVLLKASRSIKLETIANEIA